MQDEATGLQKVSEATMRFMRGTYTLDEVGNGKDELKFRRGGRTILTIYIRETHFDFLVIFGKAERDAFESKRETFAKEIQTIYDNSKTYHDGKWMLIPVADVHTLEIVKPLILFKKRPNRKPFPKEQALYSECGHRCDLCVHYTGGTISEALRMELKERLTRVYNDDGTNWGEGMMLCPGCQKQQSSEPCYQKKCAAEKRIARCRECVSYPCEKATVGLRGAIEPRSMSAEDVTWCILPFVDGQYGN